MILLSDSIKKTIAIAEGYKLGTLIIDENEDKDKIYIELEDGSTIIGVTGLIVEVLTSEGWHRLGIEDYERKTQDGWPLFGGFDCRFKEI